MFFARPARTHSEFGLCPAIPHSMTVTPANPKLKSTAASPKSTIDLGLELLIWVENGLQTPPLWAGWPSFYSITTREWERANQKPTETGQKINRPAIDLGCETRGYIKSEIVPGYASSRLAKQLFLIKKEHLVRCLARFLKMTSKQILKANRELRSKSPLEIVRWAVVQSKGRAIVSTNFRPYEAVILHLCTQVKPNMPVLWADHGYNRPATYKHAEELKKLLKLNIKAYVPKVTAAHRDAIYGEIPTTEDEAALKEFSAVMKLEPFQRGMKELAPTVWITALRKVQNPNRTALDIVSADKNFKTLKVSPVFYWSDADMEAYLKQHHLPNEWDYFDPAKADDKRECGLHADWGSKAVAKTT